MRISRRIAAVGVATACVFALGAFSAASAFAAGANTATVGVTVIEASAGDDVADVLCNETVMLDKGATLKDALLKAGFTEVDSIDKTINYKTFADSGDGHPVFAGRDSDSLAKLSWNRCVNFTSDYGGLNTKLDSVVENGSHYQFVYSEPNYTTYGFETYYFDYVDFPNLEDPMATAESFEKVINALPVTYSKDNIWDATTTMNNAKTIYYSLGTKDKRQVKKQDKINFIRLCEELEQAQDSIAIEAVANKTIKVKQGKRATATFDYMYSLSGSEAFFVKTSGNKKITVSSQGKITVKKGLKKGTYKAKVYVLCGTQEKNVKIKVKVTK